MPRKLVQAAGTHQHACGRQPTVERFESIARKRSYQVLQRKIFLINPIYQFKFGWVPRTQHAILSRLPYLRDFLSTAVYFLVSEK